MAEQLRVMISSTARDLPEHRKEVMDACLRQGMFPIMMEHLSASDDEAIPASLKMVDDADIYLLILAHRYGYVPKANNPTQISVTEHEYHRAVERKIPILTFAMHDDHPVKAADVEKGEGAIKLEAFKERALLKVTSFFISPADLRAHVIHSLSASRKAELTAVHYVSEIPAPPEVYIAHPYTLLQTRTLIGRKSELKVLTDWITEKDLEFDGHRAAADSVRIMSVVAIGGMGKSALTWKWFNDVAPREMKNLAARMWWSFYESDATFENFVTRALAYVTKRALGEVQKIPAPEREAQLLAASDHQPFLFVLDGLERVLIAYARMDASLVEDSEISREKSLRKTADPRVGSFLRKLAQTKQSRILVSSRLHPAELETDAGEPSPGIFKLSIEGLTDEDAVELWRAFDVAGSRDELLPIFKTFAKHPLLLQVLAGEVKRYRKAPGNFMQWRKANPQFNPDRFPKLKEAMGFVLETALSGLDVKAQSVLHTIAAFRMPTKYDTLAALLALNNEGNEPELDAILNELEDRGLIGWDKRANRYDLHPIVRAVVWTNLGAEAQQGIYTSLHAHFEALPEVSNLPNVENLEDLTPVIELYGTLIGLRRYEDAFNLFSNRLFRPAMYKLNASRQCAELLEMMFTDGPNWSSLLKPIDKQAASFGLLGLAYDWSGHPGKSKSLYDRANILYEQIGNSLDVCVNKSSLASALHLTGRLRESENTARGALQMSRELRTPFVQATSLYWLGLVLSARGASRDAGAALYRALAIIKAGKIKAEGGAARAFLAQYWTRLGRFGTARRYAESAFTIAENLPYKRLRIRTARRLGAAALELGDFVTADEKLNLALTQARTVNFVEEELPTLVALSELSRRQTNLEIAREFLEDTWESAERGLYALFHSDALNVLAQIERDEGNTTAATEAATKAYRLAWCDGPPFAYHWGLENAKKHLKELGAPEPPEMPPFDESKFEPMPEVEINPRDEFYVDEESHPAGSP